MTCPQLGDPYRADAISITAWWLPNTGEQIVAGWKALLWDCFNPSTERESSDVTFVDEKKSSGQMQLDERDRIFHRTSAQYGDPWRGT